MADLGLMWYSGMGNGEWGMVNKIMEIEEMLSRNDLFTLRN